MNKQTLGIIGLIGGIIAAVGVFLNWSRGVSGWDAARVWAPLMGKSANYVYVILIGGILALIGGIGILVIKIKVLEYLVPIGGILAIAGWGWCVADAGTLSGFAYGFYACLVGGIIALISGILRALAK